MTQNFWRALVLVVSTALLSACGSVGFGPGELAIIKADLGNNQTATIAVHDQWAPSWLLATDSLALNYVVKGSLQTDAQTVAVSGAEEACRDYVIASRPNELVTILSTTFLEAIVAYPFVGAASQAFKGTDFNEYGTYGSGSYAAGGFSAGILQGATRPYALADCARNLFNLYPNIGIQVLAPIQ